MFDLFDLDKERFFSRSEEIMINDICLNAHLINKKLKIKLIASGSQKGNYTKGTTPYYRMVEFKYFDYKITNKNKSNIVRVKFHKYFYKNKKDYEWFLGLEDSYSFDKKNFFYLYDDEKLSFPVSYIFMCSGHNKNTKIIEMKYNGYTVDDSCKKTFRKYAKDLLKKLFI